MVVRHRITVLSILLTLLFSVTPHCLQADIFSKAPAQAAAEGPIFHDVECELVAVADSVGVDYRAWVNSAEKGDVNSIRALLRFTTTRALNDHNVIAEIAADLHESHLGQLLKHVGDAKFAAALSLESPRMRAAIATDLGWSPAYLNRWYPRTGSVLNNKKTPLSSNKIHH